MVNKTINKIIISRPILSRWGRGCAQKHGGFYSGPDRFVPGHVMEHKFEDAMTVDKESWGIRRNININDIYRIEELIGLIAEIGSYFSTAIKIKEFSIF